MDFLSTLKGSLLENVYPKGWDFERIDRICELDKNQTLTRRPWWNEEFTPVCCESIGDFNTMLGHEIALEIKTSRDAGRELGLILPVGPMGMYRWIVYFLNLWNVDCSHLWGFNMDEWSDSDGRTLDPSNPGSFQSAMENAFYGPLGAQTVPAKQRNFATFANLPTYAEKIDALIARGGRLVTVYGIGRMCHIAFWEPHFAEEFSSVEEWASQTHRIAAMLHPLTIEQNAITSFKSRTTLVPCRANTVGPGLFLRSNRMIGGADGILSRGMQWQGMSFKMTLNYSPDIWVPSSFVPTKPGTLFFMEELAGELIPDCN